MLSITQVKRIFVCFVLSWFLVSCAGQNQNTDGAYWAGVAHIVKKIP